MRKTMGGVGPRRYLQVERVVEGMRWGPTWGEMRVAVEWLGFNGVVAQFDKNKNYSPGTELGLPPLFIYDDRWDCYTVRVGDRLVIPEPKQIQIVPRVHFPTRYKPLDSSLDGDLSRGTA